MFQRLPIALAQVKVGNPSQNLLNEIRKIIYSLYWAKKIAKKVNNKIMNSIKVQYKNNTIFMNSRISNISATHRLLLNLTDKTNLRKKKIIILLYQILAFTIQRKN